MHFNLSGRRRDGATTATLRSVVRGFRLLADDRKLFLPSKSENAFENRPGKREQIETAQRRKEIERMEATEASQGKESREVN